MTNCCGINFIRVRHIGKSNIIRRLLVNLKYFLDWNFLSIGGWYDVDTSGVDMSGDTDISVMRPEFVPSYDDGQVWKGYRKNWVYESGVEYTDLDDELHTPLTPRVYVDGSLNSDYTINYDLGQIIFDDVVSTASRVQAAYSFRNIQIYLADDLPWWQELQFNTYGAPDDQYELGNTGDWIIQGQHRVQLPCIVLEALKGYQKPAGLGPNKITRCQDILFHIISEDISMRDNLADTLVLQSDRCISLFDIDLAAANCDINLYNYAGSQDNMDYPELCETYSWGNTRLENSMIIHMDTDNKGIHRSTVKISFEVTFSRL